MKTKNRAGLKPVFHLGAIALLMAFAQAVADTGQSDTQSPGTSGETPQVSFWIEDPNTHQSIKAHTDVPDMTLWNAQRIKDYQDSLMVNGEPPIGVMTIGDVNIQIPIYDGSEDLNLNRGVGRIKGMAWLDETGNLGIAGHRDGIFRALKDIEKGDEIEVLSVYGVENYEVSSITIVDKNDLSVLDPTPDKTLTLVTCYPFYHIGHAPQRYIVTAKAIE
jgi:LPXTG-site transpeptidase (sortase) family protein